MRSITMNLITLVCIITLLASSNGVLAENAVHGESPFELEEEVQYDDTSSQRSAASVLSDLKSAVLPAKAQRPATTPNGNQTEPWRSIDNKLTLVRWIEGRHYEKRYMYLSYILEQDLPENKDLDANLAEAKVWLDLERRGEAGFGNSGTIEALEQFVDLIKLDEDETRCSFKAYEILHKNDKATQGRSQKPPSKMKPLNRIDSLVHQASRRHALACFNVYPARFLEIEADWRRTNERQLERLRKYLDSVLESETCVSSHLRDMRDDRASEQAYRLIEDLWHSKEYTQDEAGLRQGLFRRQRNYLDVNAEQVRALVGHFIIEPCQVYVQRMGTNVYVPARFSMMVLEPSERHRPSDREKRDFLHGWLHYRLCESLVRRDQEKLVKAVIKRYQWKAVTVSGKLEPSAF